MNAPELTPTESLAAAACPPVGAPASWKTPKATIARLRSGLECVDEGLRALQEWLVDALPSRATLESDLGARAADEPAGGAPPDARSRVLLRLRGLLLMPLEDIPALASILVGAHGLPVVFEALLAEPTFVVYAQRSPPYDTYRSTPNGKHERVRAGSIADRLWLGRPPDPDAAGAPRRPDDGRPLRLALGAWVDALRPHLAAASEQPRAACRALAEEARARLSIEERAALARAFADAPWAEEDAAPLLGAPTSSSNVQAARWLMPYVESDATFAALADRCRGTYLLGSSAPAEIAVRPPAERATRRLATLVRLAMAGKHTSLVVELVRVLASFTDAGAAEAIAEAALVARDEARTWFTKHPELVTCLEARARGRGKVAVEYRDLLAEIARMGATASAAGEVALEELPRCIARPPWEDRVEPWPDRELEIIVPAGRERIVETPELQQMRRQLLSGASSRPAPSPERDREILSDKRALDPPRYFELTEDAALANVGRLAAWSLGAAVARLGARAIPQIAAVMSTKPMKAHATLLAQLRTPRLALIAIAFHEDWAWLLEEPELSALGLVPELFRGPPQQRHRAELGLVRLCVEGHRAAVERAALAYGDDVADDVRRLLDRDPETRVPPVLPAIHPRFGDGSLPVLVLPSGPLPASSNRTVGLLLASSPAWLPHPGLTELRERCTLESREAFAWEVYTKTGSMDVIAQLGGDDCVRRLDQQLSAKQSKLKPSEVHHAFSVLARAGTPLSLTLLLKHALLSPWPDRNERIASLFAGIARTRGVTLHALEGATFTTLGLDSGPIVLDYGARSFRMRLDDHLVPTLEDTAGGIHAKPPRPTKKDDPAKAAAAIARFQALGLDLDDVRQTILLWFERAMATEREWDAALFERTIVAHPLLVRIARRLLWRATPGAGGRARAFRVTEDGTFADDEDATLRLSPDDRVTVLHPAHAAEDDLARFRRVFLDYRIIQPFEQLDRAVFRLGEDERAATELGRFAGRRVAAARLDALFGAAGWQHTSSISRMQRRFGDVVVELEIAAHSVHTPGSTAAHRLGVVRARTREGAVPFSRLGVVAASEVLRDLETLPEA